MELNKIYFYTATIVDWKHLLHSDKYKEILLNSLSNWVKRNKIIVYGFVIMPNHIHLIWELLEMNGKEMPHSSFMKYTAHQFLENLASEKSSLLNGFKSNLNTREHQFWQRDSLAIELYSEYVALQKLNYIHNNPVQGKWMLAQSPVEYEFSSARFYETGADEFSFLTHIGNQF